MWRWEDEINTHFFHISILLPSVADVASDGGVSLSIAVLKALTTSIDADIGKNNASVSSSKPMEKSDSNAPLATNI